GRGRCLLGQPHRPRFPGAAAEVPLVYRAAQNSAVQQVPPGGGLRQRRGHPGAGYAQGREVLRKGPQYRQSLRIWNCPCMGGPPCVIASSMFLMARTMSALLMSREGSLSW